jgi:hypothetical protein
MKKIYLTFFFIMILQGLAYSQTLSSDQLDADVQKLITLKIAYESSRGNDIKRDAALKQYRSAVDKIKEPGKGYLKALKKAVKKDRLSLSAESLPYKHLTVTEANISLRQHLIKKIDLYRVIRYSLFKNKDSILPENFRNLPIVDQKNYNKYDKAKVGDFKIASRFLLNNLSLTSTQSKFIRNGDNQSHVIDMKKYLDSDGLTDENKNFIKWAIDYLTTSPELSLAYLENVYQAVKYRDYVPRDKPNNHP